MKILIVEDEAIAAEKLSMMLKKYDQTLEVVGMIDSVKNAVKWLNTNPLPDLLFLDIYLSDGLSFEIFQKMELKVPVIFTTAYNEYAIKAFELNSIDYLLKPIRMEDIERSLTKFETVREQYIKKAQAVDYEQLINSIIDKKKAYKDRFLVKIGEKITSISTDQISYFYVSDGIAYLVTNENRQLPIDYTLDNLNDLLDPKDYFRANRQFLISHRSIESMHTYSNTRIRVILKPKSLKELLVSSEKIPLFKQWLGG
jgi:two-component system, LytTR family, response regulator LytT